MKFPGHTAVKETAEAVVLLSSYNAALIANVVLIGSARDAGNTGNTTTLRPGLVLGQITASKKFSQYADGNSNGTEVARAVLLQAVKVTDDNGADQDQLVAVLIANAVVKAANLVGIDANGRVDLKAQNVTFDDELIP